MDEISPQWYKIVGIAFFYVAILLVGIYATKQGQKKRRASMDLAEDSIVAGRNIGTFQFCFRSSFAYYQKSAALSVFCLTLSGFPGSVVWYRSTLSIFCLSADLCV